MSGGWALWVMFLVVLNMGITLFLFIWGTRVRIPTLADGTTGHVWAHGVLREGVRRLPIWWVVISASMFVLGIGYLVLYPGFGNYKGLLGWTSHDRLAAKQAANEARLDRATTGFDRPLAVLADDPTAIQLGRVLFEDNCAACHGLHGQGNQLLGAPNLTDDVWLYGGDDQTLIKTIRDGRIGTMPGWLSLGEQTVKNLAQYVLQLSGAPHDAAMAAAAKPMFATCAGCHGANGKGNPALGAPNLTDDTWLYGGSVAAIERTIRQGRNGHMPGWESRLDDRQIRALAAWVVRLSRSADESDANVAP